MEAQTHLTQTPPLQPIASGQNEQFQFLPIEWLRPSKTNPRKHFGNLAELAASIRQHGVLVPLIVRAMHPAKDTLYEIVAGERRYRAAKEAKLTELPVRVLELDDKQTLELQVIENLQRADVHPIEEADGYQQLIAKHGYTVDALAARVGKSESYVYQRLKLASLIPKAKEAFFEERITASHAVVIARLADPKKQQEALAHALGRPNWQPSFRDFQEWVQEEFYLDLHAAPWKKDDAALVPAAGACLACPKRSGFAPALFPELAKGKDLCQDAKCYHGKQTAFVKLALARNPDLKPIAVGYVDSNSAKALEREYGKFQLVDQWELQSDKKKTASAQRGLVIEAGHSNTRLGSLVWFAKQTRHSETASDTRWKQQQRRLEREREAKLFGREKLASVILAAVPPAPAERELRIVARAFFGEVHFDLRKRLAGRHGIKPPKPSEIEKLMGARIDNWGQSELSAFLVELAIGRHLQVSLYDGGKGDELIEIAQAYKLNGKPILAAGIAECKRQQQAKEARKKKTAVKGKAAGAKTAKKAKPAKKGGNTHAAAELIHRLHAKAPKAAAATA